MQFGSLFAGIGGFDRAFLNAGAESAFSVEIDQQCNSVRRRHWPDEEQHTDVTGLSVRSTTKRPNIVCAGWPCQGNSVAGQRGGMADERSGLWGEIPRILRGFAPRWFLGENVPGILSVNGGRDWLAVLRDLAELGYGTAYRILDAQWFGVAQRRRRVFIVGCLGDWQRAAEVLFESDCLPWNSTPSREAWARTAACLTRGTESRGKGGYAGRRREDDENLCVTATLNSGGNNGGFRTEPGEHLVVGSLQAHSKKHGHAMTTQQAVESGQIVAHSLRGEGFDASEDGTGRGTPIVPVAFDTTQITSPISRANPQPGDPCHTLAKGQHAPAIAYQCHGSSVGPMGTIRSGNGNETGGVPFVAAVQECQSGVAEYENAGTLRANGPGHDPVGTRIREGMRVRRLTPRECERLQGFPDDWTRFGHDDKEISDSARYRMIGNSVAVPCVEWIARRIVAAS